jgi:hypothetical protein
LVLLKRRSDRMPVKIEQPLRSPSQQSANHHA